MRFCGQRRTRSDVYEIFDALLPEVLDIIADAHEYVLIDADRAASLGRLTATRRGTAPGG